MGCDTCTPKRWNMTREIHSFTYLLPNTRHTCLYSTATDHHCPSAESMYCVCIMYRYVIMLCGLTDACTSFTYEVQLLIWLHWLPAVEAEVVSVISWVFETPVTSCDVLLTRCQNLVSHTSVSIFIFQWLFLIFYCLSTFHIMLFFHCVFSWHSSLLWWI